MNNLPPKAMAGFVLAAVAIIALFAYSMSLRAENEALELRVAELSGGVSGGSEGNGERLVAEDDGARVFRDGDDLIVELVQPGQDGEDGEDGEDSAPTAQAGQETITLGALRLGPAETATLASQLAFVPDGADRRVWFTVTFGDPEASAFATALGRVFTDAGFEVQPMTVARFLIRPGIYFMAADDEPADYVNAIQNALEATGYDVTTGRGYRAFYDEKKRDDPTWNGFEMSADQPFVIAIGRGGDDPAAPTPE